MDYLIDGAMVEAAGQALVLMFQWERMFFLAMGVIIGLVIGILPGIGGLTGFALIMPFTFTMDPVTGFAFLLGMAAVTATGDTIPAILFGVPGGGSQATVMDGVPMTRKGEAGRALSAAYMSSMLGGIFGAAVLGVSIPLLKPVILFVGTPELLAMSVFGISMVATLSGAAPLRGMVVAGVGVLLGMVGTDPKTGVLRWTLDSLYLWDGLPLLPVLLGIFALPELCELAIKRNAFSDKITFKATEGMWQGIKDCYQNWWLIIRCSSIGALLGALPGVGGSVIEWLAYGHAMRSEKGASETFTKGDVRGVIAPESANNAKEGGGLVPTVAFGVPGSASMAILLGALMIHGIQPGPDMLGKHLDITYSMVWSVALANILAAGICFLLSGQFAKLSVLRYTLILPMMMAVVFVGAFQGSRNWGDLYALLIFGLIGWGMKRFRWPRPPLVLGLVLGSLIERYMSISISRYGMEWLTRPVVIILFALAALALLRPFLREVKVNGFRSMTPARVIAFRPEDLMYLLFLGGVGAMMVMAMGWPFVSQIGPMIIGWSVLVFGTASFLGVIFRRGHLLEGRATGETDIHMDLGADDIGLTNRTIALRGATFFGWLFFYLGSMAVVGMLISAFIFVVAYMRIEGRERWSLCLMNAGGLAIFVYVVFDRLLHIPWPPTLLGELFPLLAWYVPAM